MAMVGGISAAAIAALLAALPPGPGSALQNIPFDRVSRMPVPRYPWEVAVPFDNGCAMVVAKEDAKSTSDVRRWYGACRFGLADGPGYLYGKTGQYEAIVKATFHLGYSARDRTYTRLPAGLGGGTAELVQAEPAIHRLDYDKPGGTLLDPNGNYANFIAATWDRNKGTRRDEDQLWIHKESCYVDTKAQDLTNSLRNAIIPRWPEALIAQIVPFCLKASARLKAEGRMPNFGGPNVDYTPFEKVDYGYFFVVYLRHSAYDVTNLNPYGGANELLAADQQYTAITLCPRMDSLASCEPIWRALEQPFIKRRDEINQIWRAHDADRRQRFAPLEAAWREKIAALVTAPVNPAPPAKAAITPKAAAPKPAAAKKPARVAHQ